MLENGNPAWLNGSNLLVRSDVEQKVGWDFEEFCGFGEDTRFGYEAAKMFGTSVFGWHGGESIEQQPATIAATIKQRRRWFTSSIKTLKFLPNQLSLRFWRIYAVSSWICGTLLSILVVSWVMGLSTNSALFGAFLLLILPLWVSKYEIGIHHNSTGQSKLNRLYYYVCSVLLIPVASVITSLGVVAALLQTPTKFDITSKAKPS
jgi:cellulose synthase/poly-beta-1,6-N-acetylglucosamine synthase-like glycosyltransferase